MIVFKSGWVYNAIDLNDAHGTRNGIKTDRISGSGRHRPFSDPLQAQLYTSADAS